MKRIFLISLSICVAAACASKYLWRSEIAGNVNDAEIHKIADDRYIVSASTPQALSFYEMNSTGTLQPIGQSIPRLSPYYSLQLEWLDNSAFFVARTFGVLAYGTIEGGLQWQLNLAAFDALLGDDIRLGNYYDVRLTSRRTAMVYGRGIVPNATGNARNVPFVAEISEQGELLNLFIDRQMASLDVVQEIDGVLIVRANLTAEQRQLLGYSQVIQRRNTNGDVLSEIRLGVESDSKFVFATADRVFFAESVDNQEFVSVAGWDGATLYRFPVLTPYFSTSGRMRQTGPDELMLTTGYSVEKRTLEGELIWHRSLDRSVGLKHVYLDSGLTANTVDEVRSFVSGGEIEVKREEDGSLLFKGTGRLTETALPVFNVIEPLTGKKKTFTQNGSSTIYSIEGCDLWWCSYTEIAYSPGVCAVHDLELLDDGGLITVGSYCNDEGQSERLEITRY